MKSGPYVEPPALGPSRQWSGAAGSGFATLPADPPRTTAKPACRLVTVPRQRFADQHVVGMMAFANDGGTLVGGIDRVRFHFEGETRDVLEMSPRTFVRHDGTTYECWAYWVSLRKPAGRSGDAWLFVEAIPADATIQRRVIGPFVYAMDNTPYGFDLEVAPSLPEVPGRRFQSLVLALNHLRTAAAQSARVTITEAGTYDIPKVATTWPVKNWITITASAPVTFAKPSFVGDVANQIRPRVGQLHFKGGNITFDMRFISQIKPEADTDYWYDGVAFTNSENNRTALWRAGRRPFSFLSDGAPYFTDCRFEFLGDVCNLARLARGNLVSKCYGDFTGDAHCVVYNRIEDFDSTIGDNGNPGFLQDVAALGVTYTGPAATATLAMDGSGGSDPRTVTATWGASSASFIVDASEAACNAANAAGYSAANAEQGYFVRNVAAWLNGLPGWSATILNDTRRAASLSLSGLKGLGFGAQNVKSVVLKLVSCFDQHADFYQQRWDGSSGNPTNENVIIAFNRNTNFRGQHIYLGPLFGETTRDYAVVCNAMHNKTETSQTGAVAYADWTITGSSFRGPQSHVMVVHNTWASQINRLRAFETVQTEAYQSSLYRPDAYCLMANNVSRNLQWYLGVMLDVNFITGNHSQLAENVAGNDTSIGGDHTNLFADAANGDFRPAGLLLTNARTRAFDRDIDGAAFKTLDTAGAVSSGTLDTTPPLAPPLPPPQTTTWNFSHFAAQILGTGRAEIVGPTVARAQRTTGANTGALVIALPAGTYRLRCALTEWTGNGAAHLRLRTGTLLLPVTITPDSGRELYFAAGPVDNTFTLATPANLILSSTANGRSCQLTAGTAPLLVKMS